MGLPLGRKTINKKKHQKKKYKRILEKIGDQGDDSSAEIEADYDG